VSRSALVNFALSTERPSCVVANPETPGRRRADLDGVLSSACGHRMRVFLQSRSFR
jgi:hypothetical protein